MNPDPQAGGAEAPDHLASLFPSAFVERLIEPLFANAARAARASDALGAALSHACVERLGDPAVDRDVLHGRAAREAIAGRRIRKRAVGLLADLAREAIEGVAMKGLATAYGVYPRPAYRLLPDVDILFRPDDLPRLADYLTGQGYRTTVDPRDVKPWGVLATASFAPIFPPDHGLYLDVHRAVDEPPVDRGLTTETVFSGARVCDTEWGPCPVAAPEHGFIIAALNLYRDFYRPDALKGLFDLCLMICRLGAGMDWAAMEAMARQGRFVMRLAFIAELLAALGVPRPPLFETLDLGARRKRLLAGVVADFRVMDGAPLENSRKLAFEMLLLDSPMTSVWLNIRRLCFTAAPRMHYLPGVPVLNFDRLT